jgi:hypothetical protein
MSRGFSLLDSPGLLLVNVDSSSTSPVYYQNTQPSFQHAPIIIHITEQRYWVCILFQLTKIRCKRYQSSFTVSLAEKLLIQFNKQLRL